jgi:hypothetical protein
VNLSTHSRDQPGLELKSQPRNRSMAANLTRDHLTDLAAELLRTESLPERVKFIQNLQKTTVGSEVLRLIVRDNICGAAAIVSDALWPMMD